MIGIKNKPLTKMYRVFGNRIIQYGDALSIAETGEPYNKETHQSLVCPKCGKNPTAEGHDPCIANLPGVEFACCGHGVEMGYVKFNNGITLYGHFFHMMERVSKEEFKEKSKEPGFDPLKYVIVT